MCAKLYENLSALIVEDDTQAMVEFLDVLSLYFGFVHCAENGCKGLDIIEKYHPDIIFTDISMPCMDGVDMLESVKELGINSIFIFTTAYNDTNYLLRAINIKVDAYLIKPIQIDAMLKKIEEVLKGRGISPNADTDETPHQKSALLHQTLSKREYEVFLDIAKGIKINNIAEKYKIKPKTVSTYRQRIFEKMYLNSNADIIMYAIKHNLLTVVH